MAEAKPFASLSSGLLARKGTAKPAMRPQGWGQGASLEDLGWNDMGFGNQPAPPPAQDRPEHVPSSIQALTPAPRAVPVEAASPSSPPPVVEQQRAIQASFAEPLPPVPEAPKPVEVAAAVEAPKPVAIVAPVAPAKGEAAEPVVSAEPKQPVRAEVVSLPHRPRSAPGARGKAAFTLRLEADRHLKLRLACAVRHCSAQQLVTDALDAFLEGLPEIASMAGQVPAKLGKR
jgi:hypothetical protein